MKKYIIALDEGTTSCRAILFDAEQNILGQVQREFTQYYPQPGWVEHDPMELWSCQYGVMVELLARTGIDPSEVAAIGITNQRETSIIWDRATGRPIYNAIVWQCRRTAPLVEELTARIPADRIRQKTGLLPDAYYSATKIRWILDAVPGAQERAEAGELCFGTVDSWLAYKLTGGKAHVTDVTNASRTMLYNIHTLNWDPELCSALNIPTALLPRVCSSSEVYGTVNLSGTEIPLAGMAGDQQAALFGQTCFTPGSVKNTYGTGCFMLMNTGTQIYQSQNGLTSTIAVGLPNTVEYALEGSIFVGGAVIQWLRDELGFIRESSDSEYFARKVPDTGGVYVVPAFAGLGAPHWDMYARGSIFGMTRGTGRNQIIRAALEAIAYQSVDVLRAMEADTGLRIPELKVDGGASANALLMQFQSDIARVSVSRPVIRETTALGAAYLAGLAVGLWPDRETIRRQWTLDHRFDPQIPEAQADALYAGWKKAVACTRQFAE